MRDITRGTFDHYKKMMTDLTEEEKEILQRKSENYLGLINPLIWTLIAKNRNTPAYEQIAKDIRGTLWSYLQKTNIADYLGLMILELASMTEKNLLRKAVSTYLHGKVDLDHFMKSKRDRTKILEILRARNDYTSLIWRLQGRHPSISESRPFCFVMTNHNAEAESVLESLEGRKNLETGGKNLAEFCEAQGVQDSDQELGLFYLNYLQEECRQQGTLLSSYTSQNNQHNSFLVTLSIRF